MKTFSLKNSTVRYAIYYGPIDGYVGYRTSCHDYSKTLPDYMITKNIPCVDFSAARLFVRKCDAEKLLDNLGGKGLIKEVRCFSVEDVKYD